MMVSEMTVASLQRNSIPKLKYSLVCALAIWYCKCTQF